ncbi:phosphatidylinositol N-acetylglucosaminyltransferase subunit H isoform X2 [Tursiops truncatus]|uniref:phosphatidylinositol N-acetylglucosaminyltransferase subunit H isoform X2 n=1 Tax=Tursiops truncatus TaxID=9739 RepID=UPI003CCF73B2
MPMRGSESRAGERTLEGALERRGPAWCGRAGHGGRAELLRYLWRPPGSAAPLLLPFLPGVLPQLPSDHPAFAHRCHLQRVASGLRTLHTLRGLLGYLHFVKIDHETLLIIDSLGIQMTSSYASGKESTTFIEMGQVNDVVINEAIYMDPMEPHGISQVVPLFQSAKPRLDCLIEVYRSCQDILAHQKATSTSPEGGDKIISASNRRSHSGMGAYWHRQEDKSEQDHDPASRIGHCDYVQSFMHTR